MFPFFNAFFIMLGIKKKNLSYYTIYSTLLLLLKQLWLLKFTEKHAKNDQASQVTNKYYLIEISFQSVIISIHNRNKMNLI